MNTESCDRTTVECLEHSMEHTPAHVEDIVKCINCLPEGYNYIILEEKYINDSNFEVEFRCNIQTEDEAKQWLERLSEKSYVTWRVGKTHPDTGRYNVFKIEYRCRHRGAHKIKEGSTRKSYNTLCPAWLTLTIKRYIQRSRSKQPSNDTFKEHPCVIRLKNIHNHDIGTNESLRLRDVSKEVKEKLRILYREGHTPSTAYQKLHSDAVTQYGEEYYKISEDRRFCPNKAFCYDLYYSEFQKSCKKQLPVEERFVFDDVECNELQLHTTGNYDALSVMLKNDCPDDAIIVVNDDLHNIEIIDKQKLSSDLEKCLNEMYQRFMDPPLTADKISAIKNFVSNYKQYVQSEKEFILAAHNYGKVNACSFAKRKRIDSEIDMQCNKCVKENNETDYLNTVIVSTKDIHSYSQSVIEENENENVTNDQILTNFDYR